ncbi:hypothetical protein CYMTET_26870 [Cymbomonas tetramitiformis]|uniref:1-alkyl-2-acetylglycerophosphocholine esterase n=1 Tax=Cymbomonas tetramitiformis TaxID=36881 RepID=A0AAE0FQW2_9CHLO|nr:hypothetical protein CYMTET_26870 [Cymbomonas tetramitiformis]
MLLYPGMDRAHCPLTPEGTFSERSVAVADYDAHDVLFRLYYPTDMTGIARFTSRPRWISSQDYARGYVHFLHNIPSLSFFNQLLCWFQHLFMYCVFYLARLPVHVNKAPTNEIGKLPVVVFSHGLSGMRTTYSFLCHRLAAAGYVVAAVEHRDGSASHTYAWENDSQRSFPYVHMPYDPVPNGPVILKKRREQVTFRVGEMSKVLDLLESLDQGTLRENRLGGQQIHLNSNASDFIGRLNFDNVTAIGHSFGAATVIKVCGEDKRFARCVALDPWLYAVPEDDLGRLPARAMPHLNISGASWNPVWRNEDPKGNNEARMEFLQQSYKASCPGAFARVDVAGMRHEQFSDFFVFVPHILRKKLKICPFEALNITMQAIQSFLKATSKSCESQQMCKQFLGEMDKFQDDASKVSIKHFSHGIE